MNVSYTMGLCMVNSGKATGCLTKHVQTTQSDPGKFITDFDRVQVCELAISLLSVPVQKM
jgi:hypothetical protein